MYKDANTDILDLSEYISINNNNYKFEIVSINNIEFDADRKNLVQFCDLEFDLYTENKEEATEWVRYHRAREVAGFCPSWGK